MSLPGIEGLMMPTCSQRILPRERARDRERERERGTERERHNKGEGEGARERERKVRSVRMENRVASGYSLP